MSLSTYFRKIFSYPTILGLLLVCLAFAAQPAFADTLPILEDPVAVQSTDVRVSSLHAMPAIWSVIPFLLLLGMIATGPLFYGRFWHKYYPVIAVGLGAVVVGYYLFILHDQHHPVHSLAEYASFIALLGALYVVSGGILIKVDKQGTAMVNVILLLFGAVLANFIGTTGASMLLIRPYMRLNRRRLLPYHVVFFIFIVSNVGGSLTPMGDPPLFLGFLKGVPFEWTLLNLWGPWMFAIGLLLAIFFVFDKRNKIEVVHRKPHTGKISIMGARNILFLVAVIGAIFIDPNVIELPTFLYINYHGDKISYLRELIMLITAVVAYKTSNSAALEENHFNFDPIKEVAFLFIGIFATMMPALQLIGAFAQENAHLVTANSLYWTAGSLSGVLDNAPTYLNFLAAAMGKIGLDIGNPEQVRQFADGVMLDGVSSMDYLAAVSIASVFFGAFTYIGNAPNFMVKAIAEEEGLGMPSFLNYIIKFAVPILLPVLFLTWLVFFWL